MPGDLPGLIDPIQLADHGSRLQGVILLKGFERLMALAAGGDDGGSRTVHVDLKFGRKEHGGIRMMSGTLRACVPVVCQRCLETMDLEIEARPTVLLLRPNEPEDALAPEADALTVEHPIPLATLVEDELLLAMPMTPRHEKCEFG